jgi:hypothetical protein
MIRNIETQAFFDKGLSSKIEAFNSEADKLTTERATIEGELGTIKAQAMTGDIDGLATLGKKRDQLKAKLLTNLIDSVKLSGTRGGFKSAITEAYTNERAKREEILSKREAEITDIFQRHGLGSRFLQGVLNESVSGLRQAVRDVVNVPQIETDSDKATVQELRSKIAELMG